MNNKLVILITTYKREDKLFRLLESILTSDFSRISNLVDIFIADDDPHSNLSLKIQERYSGFSNIIYHKNKINLGQGENFVKALSYLTNYSYFICPGDDDIFKTDEFIKVILELFRLKPAIMVVEFRQGRNLETGTLFSGNSRFINTPSEAIALISNFGKCASCIFSEVTLNELKYLETFFKNSMYQDKALCVFSYLKQLNKGLYLYTDLVVFNDDKFVPLRYSTRIYSNLPKTINLALIISSLYLSFLPADKLIHLYIKEYKSIWKFWFDGILMHLSPFSQFRYTLSRFYKELQYPFKYLVTKNNYFENRH
jgi:glycosyltransferase involved in cell wall biosynthesis